VFLRMKNTIRMKNCVFSDVTPCGSSKNRHFAGTYSLLYQGSVFLRSVRRLLVTASVVPISLILVTPMKEALRSSVTLVLTRATRRIIPEDTILQSNNLRTCEGNFRSRNLRYLHLKVMFN
jgi:hypothetical protein